MSQQETDTTSGRQEPHDIENEQMLLGIILRENDAIDEIPQDFKPEDFYDPIHQGIYSGIVKVLESGQEATLNMMRRFYEGEILSEDVDMTVNQYMERLVEYFGLYPKSRVLPTCNQIMLDAISRNMRRVGGELIDRVDNLGPGEKPQELADWVEGRMYSIVKGTSEQHQAISIRDAADQANELAYASYERGNAMAGITTGIDELDRKTGGMVAGNLWILAGRPSMGKSSLGVNIGTSAAISFNNKVGDGRSVAIFSLEMSHEELATRMASTNSKVPSTKIRTGQQTEDEFRTWLQGSKEVAELPMIIDDTPGLTISQITLRARRLKRTQDIGLIIVDYIGLMKGVENNSRNKVHELQEITNGLKALAKELNLPVVALSQLSRKVEARDDKRPLLSDLRDSGAIEQDADVVVFIYREEYYVKNEEPDSSDSEKYQEWCAKMDRCRGRADLILAKQRHGPTGTVNCHYDPELTKFTDLQRATHV